MDTFDHVGLQIELMHLGLAQFHSAGDGHIPVERFVLAVDDRGARLLGCRLDPAGFISAPPLVDGVVEYADRLSARFETQLDDPRDQFRMRVGTAFRGHVPSDVGLDHHRLTPLDEGAHSSQLGHCTVQHRGPFPAPDRHKDRSLPVCPAGGGLRGGHRFGSKQTFPASQGQHGSGADRRLQELTSRFHGTSLSG